MAGIIMMTLTTFFKNPFADERISMSHLLAYTTDQLEKLRAANLPELAPRRAATTAALAAFQGSSVADDSKLGQRKGRKQTKRSFRRGLGGRLGKIQAAAMARFGMQGPEMKELFPQGRQGFTKCTDDVLAPMLAGLAAALAARAGELGPDVVAAGAAVQSDWAAVYAASEAVSGEKAAAAAGVRTARAALQRELLLNLLALATLFPGEPEKLGTFAQESLLRRKAKHRPAAALPREPDQRVGN